MPVHVAVLDAGTPAARRHLRPISAVVDVTNYVMLELGQPMHAYDLGKLQRRRSSCASRRPGETLKLLDGRTIELTPDVARDRR